MKVSQETRQSYGLLSKLYQTKLKFDADACLVGDQNARTATVKGRRQLQQKNLQRPVKRDGLNIATANRLDYDRSSCWLPY
jgi:hypothetical protein